jgi:NhaP-type Na+/H+ or K+/H+ antiporter
MAKAIWIIAAFFFVSGILRIIASYITIGRFAKRDKSDKVQP